MDFKIIFSSLYERLEAKYIACIGVVCVLALANIFLVQALIVETNNRTTIVVPSHLNSRVEVGKEYASPEYIRLMSFHITGLLYSFTPYTIEKQFNEVLSYVPLGKGSEERASLVEQLQKKVDQVTRLKISESFIPNEAHMLSNSRCVVSGKLMRWSVATSVAEDEVYIEYTYHVTGGGFQIEEMRMLDAAAFTALLRREREK